MPLEHYLCAFGDWLASSSEKPIHLRVGKTSASSTPISNAFHTPRAIILRLQRLV
jgi:hypothetical protein